MFLKLESCIFEVVKSNNNNNWIFGFLFAIFPMLREIILLENFILILLLHYIQRSSLRISRTFQASLLKLNLLTFKSWVFRTLISKIYLVASSSSRMDGFCKGKYVIDKRYDVFKFIFQRFNKFLKKTFTCSNESLLDKVLPSHFHNNFKIKLLSFNPNQPLKLPLQLQSAAFDHLKLKIMQKEPDNREVKLIYFKSNTRILPWA